MSRPRAKRRIPSAVLGSRGNRPKADRQSARQVRPVGRRDALENLSPLLSITYSFSILHAPILCTPNKIRLTSHPYPLLHLIPPHSHLLIPFP